MWDLATFDIDFLRILLFDFDEVKNGSRLFILSWCMRSLIEFHALGRELCLRQRLLHETDFLYFQTLALRGLGPKGARVARCACIVRQVLCSKQMSFLF